MELKQGQIQIVHLQQLLEDDARSAAVWDHYPADDALEMAPPDERRLIDMTDEEITGLYEEELATYDTYAGIRIDDMTALQILREFTGKGGVFQLEGYVKAYDSGNGRMSGKKAEQYHNRVIAARREAYGLLRPVLEAQGVSEQDMPAKVDAVLNAIQQEFSGDREKTEHARAEKKRLAEQISKLGSGAIQLIQGEHFRS